ncbi:MAG: 16S rRNA (guanine(527)-N(7))-methyltransferase RsmG [Pseudomonadales bacterium]|jgi:16S rRNA (guanine527-N7)-methyltransferase
MADHAVQLASGAKQLGIDLQPQHSDKLLAYLGLLNKWNKAYNLTAVRDPEEMVSRHLLDSLSILSYIQGETWLDVGSGGGMPGVILAIMCPKQHFTLLDSNGKKTRFLTQVKLELGLNNLKVVNCRVEALELDEPFAGITSRAFSALGDFVDKTRQLGNAETRWLAMKGVYPEDELAAMPVDFKLERSAELSVPGCVGSRHLLILRRTDQG